MSNSFKCFMGMHVFTIHKEIPVKDKMATDVGLIVVLRCTHCGKVVSNYINFKSWS